MADFSYVNLPKTDYDRFVADTTNKIWEEIQENEFKDGKPAVKFFSASKQKIEQRKLQGVDVA